jgi:hypothetical protein
MKAMTIAVYFEDGTMPLDITIGSMVNGGKVSALATYDLFETMEIAEAALEESDDEICTEARDKIENAIRNMRGIP